jgi:hypothetical protein
VKSVVAAEPKSAGDAITPDCEQIEVHVTELRQLFNAMDPSPFRERDLDPKAEEFIVDWAQEAPPKASLALLVYLDRPAGLPDEAPLLRDAVHEFFRHRAEETRTRLRQLFRRGRTSLAIGIACLAVSLLTGKVVGKSFGEGFGALLRESLVIGGWVAMWRPMEIFLYDWWPIRAEARLYDRLGVMPVRIAYTSETGADAWRRDWPAVKPSEPAPPVAESVPH